MKGGGMVTQRKSPVLVLPKDPKLVSMLQGKLEEYKGRIRDYHEKHPNQHPDFRERMVALDICKMEILERLLREGRVVAWDASKEFIEKRQAKDVGSGGTFANAWMEAWPAIEDCCK